jgi:aspartate aminotransferase
MTLSSNTSTRIQQVLAAASPIYRFVGGAFYTENVGKPGMSDFAFGNPHEMPLQGLSDALAHYSVPQSKDWFAYKFNEPASQAIVAESLRATRGMDFDPLDIFLTLGAFGALAVTLGTILDTGDEVIFNSPPWFFYEATILSRGANAVRVKVNPQTFDLDLQAIEAAITPRTRGIIVNSPNNPTGKMYSAETLQALADILAKHSQRNGRPIYLISDEAYWRILFDNRAYISPVSCYPYTFLLYTYGKTLLAPGQRIGYIALPPTMPLEARMELRPAIFASQLVTSYSFPNALMQYALPELEKLSIDIPHLQQKRDWLVNELCAMGYQVHSPEGTFYLLPRAPLADDWKFVELLAEYKILCMPGEIVELPGYFRISLTANDEMIQNALPGFRAAFARAKA